MAIDWQDLLTGIGLLLVFEGIFPFAAPGAWRSWLAQIIEQPNQIIRVFGFVSMVVGALVLYWIH